jgi:hypothetical protein
MILILYCVKNIYYIKMLVKPHLILILLIKMYQNWTRIDFVNILFLQFVLYSIS